MARKQTIEEFLHQLRNALEQPEADYDTLIKRALLKRGLQPIEQGKINYECLKFRVQKGAVEQALQQYRTKRRHLLRHKQATYVVQMLGALISAFTKRGDYVGLRSLLLEAEDLLQRPEVPTLVAVQIYNNLAKAHIRLHNHELVAKYLHQATSLLSHYGDLQKNLREYAEILATFGVYEFLRYSFDIALDYNERALLLARNIAPDDHRWLATLYGNKGLYLLYKGDIEQAKAEYKIAYTLFITANDTLGLAENLNMQAVLYNYINDYDQARECLEQALAIGEKNGWNDIRINALLSLGRMYANSEVVSDRQKAKEYFLAAKAISEGQGLQEPSLYSELSEFYQIEHDYEQAYVYLKQASDLLLTRGAEATTLMNEVLHRSMVQAEQDSQQVVEQLRLREAELEVERQRSSNVELLRSIDNKSEMMRELEELLANEKKKHLQGNNTEALKLIEQIRKILYTPKDRTATEQKYLGAYSDAAQKLAENNPKLSSAEIIICVMTLHGLHTNQIADELTVSVRTVENQRLAARKKLGIRKELQFREALIKLFPRGK